MLDGEGVVSASKFVRRTLKLKPDELKEFDTLNLQAATHLKTSGLKKIAEDLLVKLPNLKTLNLYGSGLRTKEDLELLTYILQRFDNLQYVNIVGNSIAREVFSFVTRNGLQNELADMFRKKVVFSFESLLEDKFPKPERENYRDWYNTHKTYYEMVH